MGGVKMFKMPSTKRNIGESSQDTPVGNSIAFVKKVKLLNRQKKTDKVDNSLQKEKKCNDSRMEHMQKANKSNIKKKKKAKQMIDCSDSKCKHSQKEQLQEANKSNRMKQKKAKQIKNDSDSRVDLKEQMEQENVDEIQPNVQPGEEFTIIGAQNFKITKKVRRVLPHWLSNPEVVSVDLKNLNVAVGDIAGLHPKLVEGLRENGIAHFFPVQSQVIPWLLASSKRPHNIWPRDVCVSAPTGSGKTLAYVLPVIQELLGRVVPRIRALVVLPVQDLATQVFSVFSQYTRRTKLKVALITGSSPIELDRTRLLKKVVGGGYESVVDIVVTTPGRLVEHLMETEGFSLRQLKFLVIDEADRAMENVQHGWLAHLEEHLNRKSPTIVTIDSLVGDRPQKLLFSATLSQDPEKLQQLNLFQPKLFTSVVGRQSTAKNEFEERGEFIGKFTTPAELSEHFARCTLEAKPLVLYHLLTSRRWSRILCFVRSANSAHRLALLLATMADRVHSELSVQEISGDVPLDKRKERLAQFTAGQTDVLVCSDGIARGMDIKDVNYVICYDMPKYLKTYIHRVGRTARAGSSGTALTLLTQDQMAPFQEMMKSGGKKQVVEMNVPEKELWRLESCYKFALMKLKTTLMAEKKKQTRKLLSKKKSIVHSKKWRKNNS